MLRWATRCALAALVSTGCGRTEPAGSAFAATPVADGGPTADGGTGFDGGRRDAGCVQPFPTTVSATLRITADDEYRLWLNGALVDDAPRLWSAPQRYEVQLRSDPRAANVIAIEATNRWNQDGLDRGVVADLSWTMGPRTFRLTTDAAWLANSAPPPEWETQAFDDTSWAPAIVIARHGEPPWLQVLGSSPSLWLWTSLPSGAATTKPMVERIALRRAFSLLDGGAPGPAAPPCR